MKSCLIVDDSATIREITHEIMKGFGLFCTEAENGLEALEACKSDMPALIMLDWNMPVMNGFEFLKNLRKLADGYKPTVIFCTTENDLAYIQAAVEAGANDFMQKPFDHTVLKEKLIKSRILEPRA